MAGSDFIILLVAAANLWGALSAAMAIRAWWPRSRIGCQPASTQLFYASIIGLMLAFGGNSIVAALDVVWSGWPDTIALSRVDDLLWRFIGGAACVGMVAAKLSALPPRERASWNMVSIIFHPDADQILVRFINAAARRMPWRREF